MLKKMQALSSSYKLHLMSYYFACMMDISTYLSLKTTFPYLLFCFQIQFFHQYCFLMELKSYHFDFSLGSCCSIKNIVNDSIIHIYIFIYIKIVYVYTIYIFIYIRICFLFISRKSFSFFRSYYMLFDSARFWRFAWKLANVLQTAIFVF